MIPYLSHVLDLRDGTRCVFHRWSRMSCGAGPHRRTIRVARAAVPGVSGPSRWRVIPERFVEPLVHEATLRKRKRKAR